MWHEAEEQELDWSSLAGAPLKEKSARLPTGNLHSRYLCGIDFSRLDRASIVKRDFEGQESTWFVSLCIWCASQHDL